MEITSKRNETVLSPLFLFKCLAIPTKGDFQVRLFHSVIVTISMLLMLPLGSSATATTNYSHPQFSVTENQTLSLRETGSQLIVDAIEDALYRGGLALLGDGFQIDSSLGWVFGEDIESIDGGIDAAIPLLSKNGHIVFTQPGLVFWEGNGEEERIDANFGIVYRTDLANTPIGIDAIGGASIFYDYDFHRVGHERLSIGADIQTDNFHGAFNYYHPLSNEEDGREGFIEKSLKGVDLRIALERSVVRAGTRVGLWRFDGGEEVADDWRVSVGGDVGLRIFPGVFIEADWEKHQEDFIIDQRFKLGLAFRFSLPDFEGQSYAGGSIPTDLYKIVDREKRVLYEEREVLNEVEEEELSFLSLTAESLSISEGETTTLTVRLDEAVSEDVVINLLEGGADGDADYGTSADWHLNVGGADCATASGKDCQVTITAGQTTAEVTVEANTDSAFELPENFTISAAVDSGSADLLPPGSRSSLGFILQNPIPTISLNHAAKYGGQSSIASGTLNFVIELSESLIENFMVNFVAESMETYGVADGWFAEYQVITAGQTPRFDSSSSSTTCNNANCPITIPAGVTVVWLKVTVRTDRVPVNYRHFIEIPSTSENLVRRGIWSYRTGRV
ncbi:MAG: inverse autotransporter beta domain-containing protein [Hyphomicrobiales bacterium]|nr:inverse autotransporter beta domain-containing protein [Hyphomicrobiales bacterium]